MKASANLVPPITRHAQPHTPSDLALTPEPTPPYKVEESSHDPTTRISGIGTSSGFGCSVTPTMGPVSGAG